MVCTSSDADNCPADAYVSSGPTAGNTAGVATTCCHAAAAATTAGLLAYSARIDDHRANDVPGTGNAIS